MAGEVNNLLTINQAAEILGMSPSWVKKQIRSGVLPIAKLGRCTRVISTDLDAFIQRKRVWKIEGTIDVHGGTPADTVFFQVTEKTTGVRR